MTGRVNRRDAETQRIDFLAEVDEENEGERANREKDVRLRYLDCYEDERLLLERMFCIVERVARQSTNGPEQRKAKQFV